MASPPNVSAIPAINAGVLAAPSSQRFAGVKKPAGGGVKAPAASRIGNLSELAVPLAVLGIVFAMIAPMPAFLLDILISANITISVIVLLVSMYIIKPVEFSVFPTALLLLTLFRLSLNISSSRLILIQGNTGTSAAGQEALTRMFDFWEPAIVNPTSKEYYTKYGFSDGFDTVVQAGVLVLSPAHHRSLLEKVYFEYEEKGGPEWHYEMRPLSYELLKAGAVHWIDPRFNSVWLDDVFLHYPFVLNPPHTNGFIGRFVSKIASRLGACSATTVRRACINATFLNSYFLHFGSSAMADMRLLDTAVTSWRQCRV